MTGPMLDSLCKISLAHLSQSIEPLNLVIVDSSPTMKPTDINWLMLSPIFFLHNSIFFCLSLLLYSPFKILEWKIRIFRLFNHLRLVQWLNCPLLHVQGHMSYYIVYSNLRWPDIKPRMQWENMETRNERSIKNWIHKNWN